MWHNGIGRVLGAKTRRRIQSLARHSELQIWCCHSCSLVCYCGSDLIPGPGVPYKTGWPKKKKNDECSQPLPWWIYIDLQVPKLLLRENLASLPVVHQCQSQSWPGTVNRSPEGSEILPDPELDVQLQMHSFPHHPCGAGFRNKGHLKIQVFSRTSCCGPVVNESD